MKKGMPLRNISSMSSGVISTLKAAIELPVPRMQENALGSLQV